MCDSRLKLTTCRALFVNYISVLSMFWVKQGDKHIAILSSMYNLLNFNDFSLIVIFTGQLHSKISFSFQFLTIASKFYIINVTEQKALIIFVIIIF